MKRMMCGVLMASAMATLSVHAQKTVKFDGKMDYVLTVEKQPATQIKIDLQNATISGGGHTAKFEMKGGAREALLKGEWDALGQLIDGLPQVHTLAKKLAYV